MFELSDISLDGGLEEATSKTGIAIVKLCGLWHLVLVYIDPRWPFSWPENPSSDQPIALQ